MVQRAPGVPILDPALLAAETAETAKAAEARVSDEVAFSALRGRLPAWRSWPPGAGGIGSRPLRIVQFTDSLDPSGVGEHIALLARELHTLGHPQIVVCPDTPAARPLMEQCASLGVEVVPLRVRDERDAGDYAQLVRLLRSRCDLFHTHAGITWEGCWGAFAAAEAGVPAVCTEHLPDSLAGEDGRAFKLRMSRGVVRTIAVSHGVARSLVGHGIVPAERVRVVWNGIDVEAYAPVAPQRRAARRSKALGLPPDTRLVLCVGRFTPQKGHDVLLEAAALARRQDGRVVLALAGDGPLRDELAHRAAQLGIAGAVRFLGRHADVPQLLGCADVLVQPSRFEGLPLTVLEAMAAALPVVVTDVIGCNETVVHGESGLIVPPEDPSALAGALLEVLGDPPRAARLGAAARLRAEREFAAPVMARRTLAVYREAAQVQVQAAAA